MIRANHRIAIAALGLGLTLLPSARADVIFSDFGTGDTSQVGTGYTISGVGSSVGHEYSLGAAFRAGSTAALAEIDVAFFLAQGSGKFDLGLYADDGSGHVGSLIESFRGVGPTPGPPGGVIAVSSALHPLLTAGAGYWLIASPADPGSWVAWNLNSAGGVGTEYSIADGTARYLPGQVLPAFGVIVASVPEPSSMALLGLGGLAAVAGLRRRPRRGRP